MKIGKKGDMGVADKMVLLVLRLRTCSARKLRTKRARTHLLAVYGGWK